MHLPQVNVSRVNTTLVFTTISNDICYDALEQPRDRISDFNDLWVIR